LSRRIAVTLLRALATFLAGLAGSTLALGLVLPLGLIASEFVIFPLALGIAALFAALAAGWAANLLAVDGTRTRLLAAVGATEAIAFVMLAAILVIPVFRDAVLGPVIYIGLLCALIIALAATLFVWRLRGPERGPRDVMITLALVGLAVVSVPGVVFVAWLAGLTGA
jgi:hypothetical protein